MVNESGEVSLSIADLHLTWEEGYHAAARAAARALDLPLRAFAPQDGPVLHFGSPPADVAAGRELGDQGYVLRVEHAAGGPVVHCLGWSPQGAFYALRALRGAWEGEASVSLPLGTTVDAPAFPHRGIAEAVPTGWSWETREQLLSFAGRHQLDHYLYAPDDDAFRTVRWREPYPPPEAQGLRNFVSRAGEALVSVIYSLEPDLDPTDEADLNVLEARCDAMLAAGVQGIALFCEVAAHSAAAWACVANGLLARLRATYPHARLWIGLSSHRVDVSPSGGPLHDLAHALRPEIDVIWAGPEPGSSRLTANEASAVTHYLGRKPWLWETYPDNRFAPQRLFLGPYQGREPGLAQHLRGVTAVPMQQALASQIPLATVADFLWDPEGYDPEASWDRALREVGGGTADALRQFAGLNRSSILAYQEDEELETGLAAWELEGFHGYLARKLLALEDALGALGPLGDNQPLMRELAPWLEKAGYLVQIASRALELSYSLATTRTEAPRLYEQTVSGLGRSRELPCIVAPFRLDRFAVRVLRQAEVKLGKPLGRIQTTAPRGRDHPWGLAADGDLMTSFRSTADLQPGHSITLDMGTVVSARWIHLSQGYFYYWPAGCVEEGRLLGSADGETWQELARIDGPGAWEVDLHLDPPKAMRYLQLVNDAPRPWPMVVRQLELYE